MLTEDAAEGVGVKRSQDPNAAAKHEWMMEAIRLVRRADGSTAALSKVPPNAVFFYIDHK